MTVPEAASLIADLVRLLSASRDESRTWRALALAAVDHAQQLATELNGTRRRLIQARDELRRQQKAA